ncbi:MAG: exodeoxyribonuclease V alpha subunit [Glaciecola sp.]|jgi:exodeoxyribonuclease V alpha subunit
MNNQKNVLFSLPGNIAKRVGYASSSDCLSQLSDIYPIDYFFACSVISMRYKNYSQNVFFEQTDALQQAFHLLIALSYAQRQGHGCLDIEAIAGQGLWRELDTSEATAKQGFDFFNIEKLQPILQIFLDIDQSRGDLVFETPYLYTARYWQYEKEIADYFSAHQSQNTLPSESSFSAIKVCAEKLWPLLFTKPSTKHADKYAIENGEENGEENCEENIDWQQVSVANSLLAQTSIISGGAGTGKTYTVARLLLSWLFINKIDKKECSLALTESSISVSNRPKLLLAAPTGKAAQRLNESILGEFRQLINKPGLAELVEQLTPMIEAKTLHRLLGLGMFGIEPRYDEKKQLDCDFLVVDEVSMIDVAMMAKLLRALPAHAKLILIGDANQLPSVESGGLLKDLVNQQDWRAPELLNVYSNARLYFLQKLIPNLPVSIDNSASVSTTIASKQYDNVTFLQRSMRSKGGIKTLANMVLSGQSKALGSFLSNYMIDSDKTKQQKQADISWCPDAYTDRQGLKKPIIERMAFHYNAVFDSSTALEALAHLKHYRLLSPTRKGPVGTEILNMELEHQLKKKFSHIERGSAYKGMPIMVVQNDYKLNLFNGDVGVIWTNEKGQLIACFDSAVSDSQVNQYSLTALPNYELVYAMTIHKTQGSEFSIVDIVLPNAIANCTSNYESQYLSMELLYTGITRAKQSIGLIASLPMLEKSVEQTSARHSGLKRKLSHL